MIMAPDELILIYCYTVTHSLDCTLELLFIEEKIAMAKKRSEGEDERLIHDDLNVDTVW